MAIEATLQSGSKLNRFVQATDQKRQDLERLGARGGYAKEQKERVLNRYHSMEDAAQAAAQVEPMDFFATFFLMLPTAALLDLIDLFELTGVGLILVIALKLTLGAALCFFMYIAGKDASGNVGLAVSLLTFFIELIPGIDILPVTFFGVIIAYYISTPEFQERYRKIGETSQQIQALKAQVEQGIKVGKKIAATVKK